MENNNSSFKYKVSICVPCYKRPQKTLRSIKCLLDQNLLGWQAFIIGDGCPDFEKLLNDPNYTSMVKNINENTCNNIVTYNLDKNYGGFGYEVINRAIDACEGEYFMWYSNDDIIAPNHFSNYYNHIKEQGCDMMYFKSSVRTGESFYIRDPILAQSHVGHSELIIKSDLAKKQSPHSLEYGHDWIFIQNVINSGANIAKSNSVDITYFVMSTMHDREQGID